MPWPKKEVISGQNPFGAGCIHVKFVHVYATCDVHAMQHAKCYMLEPGNGANDARMATIRCCGCCTNEFTSLIDGTIS